MTDLGAPDALFLAFQQALAGRYSIDRELGRGGMGIVYLAREIHLDRWVALKLLPPPRADDPGLRERFLREARLAAKLSHPNIIPIHAVEEGGGFVFYVMAFVDGETLAARIHERGPLLGSEGARVLREVAWALAYAHGQGLVHRDVKPDNILLERGSGRVLVADFGIAAALTDAGAAGVSGTPEFMSPEQALGQPLDPRSDLYSLGATAFYALTGELPFSGRSATEVLARQVTEPARPIAATGVAVPRKVAALIDRCLAKDPAHRPESAQAFAEQLALALEQRRELPPALRAFVKRGGRLAGEGTLIASFAILPLAIGAGYLLGTAAGWGTLGLLAIVAPASYLLRAARNLSRLGFTHDDLAPAYRHEIETAREELAQGHRATAPLAERTFKWVAMTGMITAPLSTAAMILAVRGGLDALNYAVSWAFMLSWNAAIWGGIGYLALAQRRRDVDTEFWAKFWLGRAGRALFTLARRVLGGRARSTAMTHRATELSLGLAAEELYETLPKATRRELHGVPAMLHQLQDDARALRARGEALQDALADAGDLAPPAGDLRRTRDEVQARLRDTVAALETIRLDLLRLHAGAATVVGLTTHLGLAAELSEGVKRLVAAQGEVEHYLLRTPTPTH